MSRKPDHAVARFVCVDKAAGRTSFDCVRQLRRIVGQRRVGHAGTLDPFATGLLVCGIGPATRLLSLLSEGVKEYRAEVRFGLATDSLDCTGAVIEERPVDFDVPDLRHACAQFLGEQMQIPPQLSAIKVNGRRSYRRFRSGDRDFELEARPVTIHAIEVESFDGERASLRVECGGGTYVRSLARDLGLALGTVAHLSALRRTRVGGFGLEEAVGLEDLAESWPSSERGVYDPVRVVQDGPILALDAEQVRRVRQGWQPDRSWMELPESLPERLGLVDAHGRLVAVAEVVDQELRLRTVLPEPVA